MLDASQALIADLNSRLAAARVGNCACDIANALDGELGKVGIDRDGRCGCLIGLGHPSDWGERTVLIRAADETVLQPDMTFHCMPGPWVDGWGVETAESIVVTESGNVEALCNVERRFFLGRASPEWSGHRPAAMLGKFARLTGQDSSERHEPPARAPRV